MVIDSKARELELHRPFGAQKIVNEPLMWDIELQDDLHCLCWANAHLTVTVP